MIATSGFLTALECTKFVFAQGSARTPLEELTVLPQTHSWFKGVYTSKGGEEKRGKRRGREEEGKERRVNGRGETAPLRKLRPWNSFSKVNRSIRT